MTSPSRRAPTRTRLITFLNDRRGYCEQFAATMALMARLEGIPARVDVGFTPGAPVGNTKILRRHDRRRPCVARVVLPGRRVAAVRAHPSVGRPDDHPGLRAADAGAAGRRRRCRQERRGRRRAARHPGTSRSPRSGDPQERQFDPGIQPPAGWVGSPLGHRRRRHRHRPRSRAGSPDGVDGHPPTRKLHAHTRPGRSSATTCATLGSNGAVKPIRREEPRRLWWQLEDWRWTSRPSRHSRG